MTHLDIKLCKAELEKSIATLLNDFHQKTGFVISFLSTQVVTEKYSLYESENVAFVGNDVFTTIDII